MSQQVILITSTEIMQLHIDIIICCEQALREMDSLSVPQSVSAAVLVCLCSSITRFSCFGPFDLSSGRLGDVYYAQPQLQSKDALGVCKLYTLPEATVVSFIV